MPTARMLASATSITAVSSAMPRWPARRFNWSPR
jgi:hypothetical protein